MMRCARVSLRRQWHEAGAGASLFGDMFRGLKPAATPKGNYRSSSTLVEKRMTFRPPERTRWGTWCCGAYSSRRTSRGFWPRMRWLAIQPVMTVSAAAMASAVRLRGMFGLEGEVHRGDAFRCAQAMMLAKRMPTVPATRPRTANSMEKMVAMRARVAPRVLRTTTSRMRR